MSSEDIFDFVDALEQQTYAAGLLGSVLLNCESELDPRLQNQIVKLLATIRDWPKWDPSDEDKIETKLAAIHTKSRYILQRLNIPSKVIDRSVDGDF
ncbi:hypothetical protein Hamer_G012687 [Homarus americanus]|uniref:Uncharacterized protein n=1 Tax=Homarus americanus TaxID=6706 RepID=A0A8J5MQM4_HOMAM|nr:hypothetical protein Hamer_G012687 [Homarus americanus]